MNMQRVSTLPHLVGLAVAGPELGLDAHVGLVLVAREHVQAERRRAHRVQRAVGRVVPDGDRHITTSLRLVQRSNALFFFMMVSPRPGVGTCVGMCPNSCRWRRSLLECGGVLAVLDLDGRPRRQALGANTQAADNIQKSRGLGGSAWLSGASKQTVFYR
jgi:hypothetical protein